MPLPIWPAPATSTCPTLHGGGPYISAMVVRPATPRRRRGDRADPGARLAGRLPAPLSAGAARRARARLDALGAADRAPAVRLGHVRRGGARAHGRLRLARPEPRRARGRRAVRDLRRPRRVVARRRARAHRAGGVAARRAVRAGDALGAGGQRAGAPLLRGGRAGVRTARASGSSASASHRPRCDTGSASPFPPEYTCLFGDVAHVFFGHDSHSSMSFSDKCGKSFAILSHFVHCSRES